MGCLIDWVRLRDLIHDIENTSANHLSSIGMFLAITILKFDDLEDWVQEV